MPIVDYDEMHIDELAKFVVYTDADARSRRDALSALSRRDSIQRTPRLVTAMRNYVLRYPDRYDQDLMMSIIDILATDPHPDATAAMLDVFPDVVMAGIDPNSQLRSDFREYFYECMVTRQREADLAVWAEMLPDLDPKVLVAAVADPVGGALAVIEPITLLDRKEEPHRTRALFSAISSIFQTGASKAPVKPAVQALRRSANTEEFEQGIERLAQQWDKLKASGRAEVAALMEKVLAGLDRRPRTPVERLTGKRPWAP